MELKPHTLAQRTVMDHQRPCKSEPPDHFPAIPMLSGAKLRSVTLVQCCRPVRMPWVPHEPKAYTAAAIAL